MTLNRKVGAFIWACICWNYTRPALGDYKKRVRLGFGERYRWHLFLNSVRERKSGKLVPFKFFIHEA